MIITNITLILIILNALNKKYMTILNTILRISMYFISKLAYAYVGT